MFYAILLLTLVKQIISADRVSADLVIVTYEPLKFNLSFTAPVDLPQFQLLFNDIPIRWNSEEKEKCKHFIIYGYTDNLNPADYITEKYVLMFTQPMTIAEGNLSLDSFLLRAHRNYNVSTAMTLPIRKIGSHFILQTSTSQINLAAIFITSFYYFFAFTTITGLNGFYFVSLYAFICMKTPLFTALDFNIAYYLMFDPSSIENNETFKFIYICIPHMLVFVTFVVGVISRLKLKELAMRSALWNYAYYYLSYKLFILTWGIMLTPMFCNVAQIYHGYTTFQVINPIIIKFYIYFSCACIAFYCYICYLTTNPQLYQSDEKWKKYTTSSHYSLTQAFHLGIDGTDWKKRNTLLIFTILKIFLLILISFNIVGIPNLFYQIIQLIFIFTLRPYKYGFFNNFIITIQIFIIIFYLFRHIVRLYMGISEQITTSTDVSRILIATLTFFSLISLTFFIAGSFELFKRIKSLIANVNSWKNESKYIANEGNIRKATHSAFKKQQQKQDHSKRKRSTQKKRRKSPEGKLVQNKIEKQEELKTMKSLKLTQQLNKKAENLHEKNTNDQNKVRKVKQKSSLLQSISLRNQMV